jgi:molybdopterin-guanine dinucleotide biosynthesis protein A
MNLGAVILAGGQSRRMGQDKAWLKVGGESLIALALSTVRASGIEEIMISGRTDVNYSKLQCQVLFDVEPGRGPLSGIDRALEAVSTPLLLVLAVDLPNMSATFLRALAGHCGPLTGAVPELKGQLEPLAAVYPKRCRSLARDCLRKGRRAVRDFAEACLHEQAVKTFMVSEVDAACFDNWNSPADVKHIRALHKGGTQRHADL